MKNGMISFQERLQCGWFTNKRMTLNSSHFRKALVTQVCPCGHLYYSPLLPRSALLKTLAMSAASQDVSSKKGYQSKKMSQADLEAKFDFNRRTTADPRDPRMLGAPCHGSHTEASCYRGSPSGQNKWALWRGCEVCKLRLEYVPAFGAPGCYRQSGALPSDVDSQTQQHGEEAVKRSPLLKDKKIAYDGAEKSCLTQLEHIRRQKEKLDKGNTMKQAPVTPVPKSVVPPPKTQPQASIVIPDTEEMAQTGSRKTRKGPSENLEEEVAVASPSPTTTSWSVTSTPPVPNQ